MWVLQDERAFICYRYHGRPLVKLNLNNGQFYASKAEIYIFGKGAVQNQANIILDIIKQDGFSVATS